jgi:predicted ABC-type ATPase
MSHVMVIAGPNGAGKSTIAPYLLRDSLGVSEFVNAHTIAQGLSAFSPEKASISAGKIMLRRLNELAEAEADFAYETTLSTKSFVRQLNILRAHGYEFTLIFLWLRNVDLALMRVAERVSRGGHDIPSDTIRRRYEKGLQNFFRLYLPIADNWFFYDNSALSEPVLIARGKLLLTINVLKPKLWQNIRGKYEKP